MQVMPGQAAPDLPLKKADWSSLCTATRARQLRLVDFMYIEGRPAVRVQHGRLCCTGIGGASALFLWYNYGPNYTMKATKTQMAVRRSNATRRVDTIERSIPLFLKRVHTSNEYPVAKANSEGQNIPASDGEAKCHSSCYLSGEHIRFEFPSQEAGFRSGGRKSTQESKQLLHSHTVQRGSR